MTKEMQYIADEREVTEERIANGMALLNSNVDKYNDMLEYAQLVKQQYFDLYFKVKSKSQSVYRQLPVTNEELRLLRTIDGFKKRELEKEVSDVREPVLFSDTLNHVRKMKHL